MDTETLTWADLGRTLVYIRMPDYVTSPNGAGRPGFVTRDLEYRLGIDRDTVYKRAGRDPQFTAAWAQAREDAIDGLEAEARRRALSTSDTLLMFLLRANRPAKYRDNARLELTGEGGGPIVTAQVLADMGDRDKAALRRAIDEVLAEEPA